MIYEAKLIMARVPAKLHLLTLSWASCVRTRSLGLAGEGPALLSVPNRNPFERVEVVSRDDLFVLIEDHQRSLAGLEVIEASYTDAQGPHELILKKIWGGKNNLHRRTVVFQGKPPAPFSLTIRFGLERGQLTFTATYSGMPAPCFIPWRSSR